MRKLVNFLFMHSVRSVRRWSFEFGMRRYSLSEVVIDMLSVMQFSCAEACILLQSDF